MTDDNSFDVMAQHITRTQLTNLSPENKMLRSSMGLDQEHKAYQASIKIRESMSKKKKTSKTIWNDSVRNCDAEKFLE